MYVPPSWVAGAIHPPEYRTLFVFVVVCIFVCVILGRLISLGGGRGASTWMLMQNPWEQQAKREKSRRLMNVKATTTPEMIHFQWRERMIHRLILEMIASTDFISHFKAGENKVCSHVTGRNGGLQLGMEQCSEF